MAKIKVCYVSANSYIGGAEKFVQNALLSHKHSSHIEVKLIVFQKGLLSQWAIDNDIPVFCFNKPFRLRSLISLIKLIHFLQKIFSHEKFHIIHNTMGYTHLICSLVPARYKSNVVWFQHGPLGGIIDTFAGLFPVDSMFFNSEYTRIEHYKKPLLFHAKFDEIIPLAINMSDPKRRKQPNDKLIKIGLAGRFTNWKGYHLIILAMSHLKRNLSPENFKRLVVEICGSPNSQSDHEYLSQCSNMIKSLGLADKIHIYTHRELDQWFDQLSIFIHASLIAEPFGIIVGEAMKKKVLVLTTGKGGVGDIAIDNETAMIFRPNAAELNLVLAQMVRNWNNQNCIRFRNYLIDQAYNKVSNHYSMQCMQTRIENAYAKVMSF